MDDMTSGASCCVTLPDLTVIVPRAFLREDGLRWDGRSPQDPRKLFMSVGMITQAKGSSYLEVGNTKVCCGVYGP
ncbi:hypothetical protein O3P69_019431 [Scylla paramamosain]|uniref:Exoribonuclease phosphorolytic domain-containing protein n=1 Tax=Scylla paramamosain TaxID=85552 RepID=A0AAW0SWK5_SCYPA